MSNICLCVVVYYIVLEMVTVKIYKSKIKENKWILGSMQYGYFNVGFIDGLSFGAVMFCKLTTIDELVVLPCNKKKQNSLAEWKWLNST